LSPADDANLTKTNTIGTLNFWSARSELEANRPHSREISALCLARTACEEKIFDTIAVDFIDENGTVGTCALTPGQNLREVGLVRPA
jgi:hypothetical protein